MNTKSFNNMEGYVAPESEIIRIAPMSAVLDESTFETIECNPIEELDW